MIKAVSAVLLASASVCLLSAEPQDPIVFRSDVSLVRVDAQVVDGGNRAITHLRAEDFVVREEGRTQPIRNFASEDMPLDVGAWRLASNAFPRSAHSFSIAPKVRREAF